MGRKRFVGFVSSYRERVASMRGAWFIRVFYLPESHVAGKRIKKIRFFAQRIFYEDIRLYNN
jgi:hypothetical protein